MRFVFFIRFWIKLMIENEKNKNTKQNIELKKKSMWIRFSFSRIHTHTFISGTHASTQPTLSDLLVLLSQLPSGRDEKSTRFAYLHR